MKPNDNLTLDEIRELKMLNVADPREVYNFEELFNNDEIREDFNNLIDTEYNVD